MAHNSHSFVEGAAFSSDDVNVYSADGEPQVIHSGTVSSNYFQILGYVPTKGQDMEVVTDFDGPDFFHTMGIAIRQGCDFTDADNSTSPKVTVINEAMAQRYWPKGNALGSHQRRSLFPDVLPVLLAMYCLKHYGSGLRTLRVRVGSQPASLTSKEKTKWPSRFKNSSQHSCSSEQTARPHPEFSVEQVPDMYVNAYPELATAAIEGPTLVSGTMQYVFTRAIGAKG